jgi:hypothetical protein
VPTVSITDEEWNALCMFHGEAHDLCESSDENYIKHFEVHNSHFNKLRSKYLKAKAKQDAKAEKKA